MKLDKTYTLEEFAKMLGATYLGDPKLQISGINEIHTVEKGDVVFVDHKKYYAKALDSAADVILIDQEIEFPEGKGLIISDTPFDDFNSVLKKFFPEKNWTEQVSGDLKCGKNTQIYANVSIGHEVEIGKDCIIHSGVVLCDGTIIGNNVVIGPNSVIGHSAFYYKRNADGYDKLHSCGRAVIGDNVEIGALVTIDKGVTADTVIGAGTKIDNQVHIGHDTQIGKDCLLAANVGVAGCVNILNGVTLWGQVGIASDITIHDKVTILAQSGVTKDLEANKTYFGSPADEVRIKWKEFAAVRRLPSIIENL
ncbi:UDP-3-O-(3-hydroxymyristoyl)glucosamine N-acyltransferase [Crocinitomix catalasitica]|nr:UDP-3-O-(3-hydroxymyristoyl)glucosamine N-acyltransferase [Crocinitomix catalasitica]